MQLQFLPAAPPPVGVLFDGAFDCVGDLLALSLLYGLDGKDEMRVVAISVSRPDFGAAQFCDTVRRFYSSKMAGLGAPFPIGLPEGKPKPLPVFETVMAKTGENGARPYKPLLQKFNETADPATMLRNALTASHPKNSIMLTSGPLTALAGLLAIRSAKDLIAANVRYLVIAAGDFARNQPDPHMAADVKAAQRVFDEWPTPIYACGAEMGCVRYPGASIEKDFAWSKAHPVADAYRAFQPMPYDAPASTMAAALYAVRPSAGYFKLSEPGIFRASASGAIEFTPSAQGTHRHLIPDESQTANVVKALTELASAQPVVRVRKFPKAEDKADKPPTNDTPEKK
jgi:hypothetical protein